MSYLKAKILRVFVLLCASFFVSHSASGSQLRCVTLVEVGEMLSGNTHYYDRFDGNPKRVATIFNFEQLYFVSYQGKRFDLLDLGRDTYAIKSDPRYKFLAKNSGALVLEARVERDATTLKIFECE